MLTLCYAHNRPHRHLMLWQVKEAHSFFFFLIDFLKSSFLFRATWRGRYGDLQKTTCPPTHARRPSLPTSPSRPVHLLQLMNKLIHHYPPKSMKFKSGFTLAVVLSLGLDTYIMASIVIILYRVASPCCVLIITSFLLTCCCKYMCVGFCVDVCF